MFPKLCASRFHVEKLKIDYMTYFSDMNQYDKLVDRLQIATKAENGPKGKSSQLKYTLYEALGDQIPGRKGLDIENYQPFRLLYKDKEFIKHTTVRGYL